MHLRDRKYYAGKIKLASFSYSCTIANLWKNIIIQWLNIFKTIIATYFAWLHISDLRANRKQNLLTAQHSVTVFRKWHNKSTLLIKKGTNNGWWTIVYRTAGFPWTGRNRICHVEEISFPVATFIGHLEWFFNYVLSGSARTIPCWSRRAL